MAYFKLTLLTPYSSKVSTASRDIYNLVYFEDTITEFNPQLSAYQSKQNHADNEINLLEVAGSALTDDYENSLLGYTKDHPVEGYSLSNNNYNLKTRKFSTSFSYGEKITFAQNAQRTLSFSMNRYIIVENERLENPFVNLIQTGTQLLLTDQYGNEYFFTVSNIKYTIKETNIIYDYNCQDSFSYQTSQQTQNYYIDNDPSSADFIGPKTADWWIVHKVVPECYLSNYNYIPCSRALYESTNGSYILCDSLEDKTDVKRIIKAPYKPPVYKTDGTVREENDIDFYTTFAYSCSGMNALSVLIDIASKINMQLMTFEHAKVKDSKRTQYFDRFFWIEPLKNDRRVGLTYSPRRDIQSFDLTHNGQSLTTVMSVTGPTYNDEIITLIPDIPLFFHNYFLRPEWKTQNYTSGMFMQACSGESFFGQDDFTTQDIVEKTNRFKIDVEHRIKLTNALLLPIYNKEVNSIKLLNFNSDLYDHFTFISDDKDIESQQSQIQYTNEDSKTITSTPYSETWVLAQEKDDFDPENPQLNSYNLFYPGQNFTSSIDKTKKVYLCLIFNNTLSLTNINYAQVFLKFFRDVSQEELEFATIADKCPWLENKLIDFNYFYQQNIISRKEYDSLINILYNDLRKVNGHLIYYTQAYYKAIHDKTEMLANLTNQLDTLGAAAQAAIIDPLATTGKVKDDSYFTNAYNTVFNTGKQEIMGLLDYNSIISDYFTKYFNAEQRFLKNIYNFRKFFNAVNPLNNKALYTYKLTIDQPDWIYIDWSDSNSLPRHFYGFANNNFISLNNATYPYIYYSGCGGVGQEDNTEVFDYGKPSLQIFLNEKGRFTAVPVASKDKWSNNLLYRYPNFKGKEAYCTEYSRYNEKQKYLRLSFKIPIKKILGSDNYCWDAKRYNKNSGGIIAGDYTRPIAALSTQNYKIDSKRQIDEVANLNDQSLLYGLYKLFFTIDNSGTETTYATICKTEKVIYENSQYYILLTPVHQGKWTTDIDNLDENENDHGHGYGAENYIEIFSILFPNQTLNFENSSYKALDNIQLNISSIYWNDDNKKYKDTYFSKSNPHSEWYEIYVPQQMFGGSEAYIGLTSASNQDLQDNWVFNYFNKTNSCFIKSKPIYKEFLQSSEDSTFQQFNNWASGQLLAFIQEASEEDLKDDKKQKYYDDSTPIPYVSGKDGEKEWLYGIYKTNFPITDFYVQTPRYRVSEISDNKYIFERLNEKNQSLTKYLEYVFNKSDFVLPAVENPYTFTEYQRVNYVNEENESQFYRRVINKPNAGVATGLSLGAAGIFIFGPAAPWMIPAYIGIAVGTAFGADAIAEATQSWSTSGVTSRDFYGKRFSKDGFTRFSGYRSDSLAGKEIYAITENSFSLWQSYTTAFKKSFSNEATVTLETIQKWERRKDQVWESAIASRQDGVTKVTLKRLSTIQPFYYALYDQHIGYDYTALIQRSEEQKDPQEISTGNTTLTLAMNPTKIYYIDKVITALKADDKINKNDNIFMLWVGDNKTNTLICDDTKFKEFLKTPFSAIWYYPLVNNFQKINISTLDWGESDNLSLEQIITNGKRWARSSNSSDGYYQYIYMPSQSGVNGYAIFFRITDYSQESIHDYFVYPDNIAAVQPRIFDNTTLSDFNFFVQDDIVKGFYVATDMTKDRVLASVQDADKGFDMDTAYYTEDGTRIYTIKQLKERGSYIYLHNFIYEKDDIGNNIDTFNINLSKYNITYKQENGLYYITSINEEPLNDIYEIQFTLQYKDENNIYSEKILDINDSDNVKINLTGTLNTPISGLSNGTFWYLYHTSVNLPILFSTAASIEAELTGYWNEAYTASKFCEYFLPESWTPTSNQKENIFSQAIFTIKDIGYVDEETEEWVKTGEKAELINNFLPDVNICRDINGKTILKRYQFVFETNPSRNIKHLINTNYVLEDQNIETIPSTSIILNNFAIRNAMKALYRYNDQEIYDIATKWQLTEIGKTTYYYAETGGTSWASLVQQYVSSNSFNEFDGWYLMAIRWLKRHYQNWVLEEYEQAKQEHDNIWNKIYQAFGHIILEKTFTSETATSSTELLNEAILQFKDKSEPERQYNITVIDAASLDNYDGSEIRVGDGIRVKANDYYDQQDLIYKSLSQYLFITDIKYTLRDVTSIGLTVNDVKYADTIVKRLAKLIK